jgi:hypothetical protein
MEQQAEVTILAVEPEANGFAKIRTDQGDHTTKFAEAIAEAQAHIGQRVRISFELGEARQGRNGNWYPPPSYFKRVVSPGYQQPQAFAGQPQQIQPTMPQAPPPQPQLPPVQQQPPQRDESRELRIMRQTAGKLAVATMALVPSEQRTFQNQVGIAEAWIRYFLGGPASAGVQPQPSQEQQMAALGGAPPHDDIPF